ncbi:MAG: FAD-dependent oxidoreductase [Armatimonadetes bacterium]|nr:FAD-dependent oxidoreductase [Armatimonadota bacterium]
MSLSTRYLIIGGGVSGPACSMAIREHDTEGGITIVCGENHPPYDRPPLSKPALFKDEWQFDDAYSKFDNFYPDNKIELIIGCQAKRIDRTHRRVQLEDGREIEYENLLIATGSGSRRFENGGNLPGVYYLRRLEESAAIKQAIHESQPLVIIGGGYIGMEVAAACAKLGVPATLIERNAHLWPRFAGSETGEFLKSHFGKLGIAFHLGDAASSIEARDGGLVVTTEEGVEHPAKAVVVAIGAALNTELALGAGLEGSPEHGVSVDSYLQTSDPNVWACGDIANFEDIAMGKRWHIEHHLNARWQGLAAGANMAGANEPYDRVPYFWSDVHDISMILRGDPENPAGVRYVGDVQAGEFAELRYDAGGALRMGLAVSHDEKKLDPVSDTLEELIRAKAQAGSITAESLGVG